VLVIGVDGCPGGWVAVAWDTEAGTLSPTVHTAFAAVLTAYADAEAIGVDIPIGLVEGRPRGADAAARKRLGPRRNSVFPAPDPRVLVASGALGDYGATSTRSRELTGRGISRQAYAIYPKVAEVDALVTAAMQTRVVECHPEVSFAELAGGPMAHPKRTPAGYESRREALARVLGLPIWDRTAARSVARPATPDDVLDAVAVAWSARRHAEGRAVSIPEEPELDARGRRCQIVV
jgi:predicted RNase H-like nuclease